MANITINQASQILWDLLLCLDNCYWEANGSDNKDRVYNLIRVLNAEYIELLKISVQDHHYDYEVISVSLDEMRTLLDDFISVCRSITRRTCTNEQLVDLLKRFSHTLH